MGFRAQFAPAAMLSRMSALGQKQTPASFTCPLYPQKRTFIQQVSVVSYLSLISG
jgi:hypothetical protein